MHGSWHVSPIDVMDSEDIAAITARWPAEWRELFEERAGIQQFLALNPRIPAEREAVKEVQRAAAQAAAPLPIE